MPRVPTQQEQYRPAPLTGGESRVNATPDAFGATQGAQMQQLGKGLGDASNAAFAFQQRQDEAAAKDVDIRYTQDLSNLLYHPETGYMSRQGRNAVDTFKDTEAAVQKLQADTLGGLADRPEARKLAVGVIAQRGAAAMQSVMQHAAGQSQKWRAETSNARAETTLTAAADTPDNAEVFSLALHTAMDEAEAQAKLHGWDAATTTAHKLKYADFAYTRRYAAWADRDPVAAFTDFAKNGVNISPLVRSQLRNKLFNDAAPVLADQLNHIGGVGVVEPPPASAAVKGASTTPPANLPRGERNNNPGNIMKSETTWRGEVRGNDPRYASFETPEAGIRAMAKVLDTYSAKHGLNTVQDIISRWAPATENNTGAYIKTVATALGVKPNEHLDLSNKATLSALVKSIIQVENGKQPYTDQQIAHGIGMASAYGHEPALGDAPAAPGQPADDPTAARPVGKPTATTPRELSTPTGIPLLDALPDNEKLHVMQLARTQGAKAMADARELLRGRVQDAQAEYMARGTATNPPPAEEFIRAYGQAEGVRRHRALQEVAALGRQVQEVRTLPSHSLDRLAQTEPPPGDGFADRQHNYEILTKAIDQVQDQRKKNPVGFALDVGSYGIRPMAAQDLKDPQALSVALRSRAAAAPRIADDYGTPVSLLSVEEAKGLSSLLKAAPVETQKSYLGQMFKGVGDLSLFKTTMQALAPDNPVMAVAGIYQARGLRMTDGRDVADLMLRGQAILSPNKKEDGKGHEGGQSLVKMPEEKLLLSDFNATSGDAFKGKEQSMDLFYQASKAIYAARSAEEGDYSGQIDSKRWKAAIQLATGGIDAHNGGKIVMPYGMARDVFQDTLKARVDQLVATNPPVAASAGDLLRLPLENFGDGRYLFRRGAGYVVDKNGRPLVVDVNAGPPIARAGVGKTNEASGHVQ